MPCPDDAAHDPRVRRRARVRGVTAELLVAGPTGRTAIIDPHRRTRASALRVAADLAADGTVAAWTGNPNGRTPGPLAVAALDPEETRVTVSTGLEGGRSILDLAPMPPDEFVDRLADGALVFSDTAATGPVADDVVYWETSCWSCQRPFVAWSVSESASTRCQRCGIVHHGNGSSGLLWPGRPRPEARTQVVDAVRAQAGDTILARIGPVTTKAAGTYVGFSCPACRAPFGDWYMSEERMERSVEGRLDHVAAPTGGSGSMVRHWCLAD